MRLLLDTHALLWWSTDDVALSRRAYDAIRDNEAGVYVSAASAWEIATKSRLGKLPGSERLASELATYLDSQGFVALAVTLAHGVRAGALPGPHKDPFDRMLIAQAHAEQLTLVSNETAFDRYGVARLW